MTTRTIALTDALLDYVAAFDSARDALTAELIEETRAAPAVVTIGSRC